MFLITSYVCLNPIQLFIAFAQQAADADANLTPANWKTRNRGCHLSLECVFFRLVGSGKNDWINIADFKSWPSPCEESEKHRWAKTGIRIINWNKAKLTNKYVSQCIVLTPRDEIWSQFHLLSSYHMSVLYFQFLTALFLLVGHAVDKMTATAARGYILAPVHCLCKHKLFSKLAAIYIPRRFASMFLTLLFHERCDSAWRSDKHIFIIIYSASS